MNILRHKSWHVRTKKNIARVRRDEEKARKEEEDKQWKIDNAEKSARIEYLRNKKSGQSSRQNQNEESDAVQDQSKLAFELFEDYKDKAQIDRDKDDEKKVEQEKWEVKAGIFSYLDGRYKHEKDDEDQWYTKSSNQRRLMPESNAKDNNVKQRLDPLEKMKYFNKEIEKNQNKPKTFNGTTTTLKPFASFYSHPGSSSTSSYRDKTPSKKTSNEPKRHGKRRRRDSDSDSDRPKKKRSKKSSKKSRKYSSDSDSGPEVSKALIDKLRQERLERERKAQEQTRILLNLPDKTVKPPDNRKYNSQYNPHLISK